MLRRVARPLLSTIFIFGGINELNNPEHHHEPARYIRDMGAQAVPAAADTDENLLVQIDAGVKIGAGALLALGWMPRLAAASLAASIVPTTLAAHAFWDIKDEGERSAQQVHFFKNASLLGGLLIAAADTAGKPSAAWRARETKREAERAAKAARKSALRESKNLSRRARKATVKEAERNAKRAAKAGNTLSEIGVGTAQASKRDLERARKAAGRKAGKARQKAGV